MMHVVFDTNVVASASFWRGTPFDCLIAWTNGRCEAVVSPALLAEYHEPLRNYVWNMLPGNLSRGLMCWPSPRL
jgi:predicted nucleic acid-binding protein